MTVNSSLSSPPNVYSCFESKLGVTIITAFLITKLLVFLPFLIAVLYLGLQRWRQQRSFATTSHSDIFTYHFAVIQFIFAVGAIFYCCGERSGLKELIIASYYFCSVGLVGESCFHILTCLERYLAVVYPIIYREMKQSGRGVKIRNASLWCTWLICFGWVGVTALYFPSTPYIPQLCLIILSLVLVSFCSLSVLWVLIRPGPGRTAVEGAQVDQLKQRAFHTIKAITAVLWLLNVGFFVSASMDNSRVMNYVGECVVILIANVATLPSSLVLPLLFLHRAGKLPSCSYSN